MAKEVKSPVIAFRGFRRMTTENAERLRSIKRSTKPVKADNPRYTPDVIQEMFAPDPETGNPSSDFFVRMHGDDDVARYIDDFFMQRLPGSPVTEDSDLALNTAKSRFESNMEYADRLRSYIGNDVK